MDTKILAVGSAKTKNTQRRKPRIRLSGFWLDAIGFEHDRLVSVSFDIGHIVLKVHGTGTDAYSKLVKGLIRSKSGLLQVRQTLKNKKHTTHLEVKGFWLDNLGFSIGSVIAVQSEYGAIRIKLLDIDKLGI